MENTASFSNSHDSGLDLSLSSKIAESTPKHSDQSHHQLRKKRKFHFSTTLNESSLVDNLESLEIESGAFLQRANHASGKHEIRSVPCTPERQLVSKVGRTTKSGGCSFDKLILSPIKEAREILYANIAPVHPRRTLTPQKIRSGCEKLSSPTSKKRLFVKPHIHLLNDVLGNNVIMDKILTLLSNGDLYRLSMVSKAFRNAIFSNFNAFQRLNAYLEVYRINKENYMITPPGSPERNDLSNAFADKNFSSFYTLGQMLKENQYLNKCPNCSKASIVQNNLSQCQNPNCGYIYCQKCLSFSTNGPEYFIDKCKNSELQQMKRPKLEDLSNSTFSSILNHSTPKHVINSSSSGFYSQSDQSDQPSPLERRPARRNLFGGEQQRKIFSNSNDQTLMKLKRRQSLPSYSFVPVVKGCGIEVHKADSPSPPSKSYSACSKQSKKNLKRLTR